MDERDPRRQLRRARKCVQAPSTVYPHPKLNSSSPQNKDNLIPDYIQGGPDFSDSSASAALVSVAYRSATLFPETFGVNYTKSAGKVRDAVIGGIDGMGLLSPVVDPLSFNSTGILSTEGQAFGLMMFAAWKAWLER